MNHAAGINAYYLGVWMREKGMPRILVCVDCSEQFSGEEEAYRHQVDGCELSNYDRCYFSFREGDRRPPL